MGIIKKQTLGKTTFALIDDIYPQFTASTKIIAINNQGRVFSNVPYSTMWIPMEGISYGEMSAWNINLTSSWIVGDDGIWYLWGDVLAPLTGNTDNLKDFTISNTGSNFVLSAKTNTLSRCLFTHTTTLQQVSSTTGDEMNFEFGTSFNNSSPSWGINGGCLPDRTDGLLTGYSTRILNINGDMRDFVCPILRLYVGGGATTTGGSVRSKNVKHTVRLLEEPTFLTNDYWINGNTNDWVLVNGSQSNKWIIASGNSYSGNYSAYISNDEINNTYTGVTSISHIYKDITFPKNTPSSFLSFMYKSNGFGGSTPGTTSGVTLYEDWESGSFGANNWTTANNGTNAWYVGTSTSSGGTYSAYISNDAGTTNAFTNTLTQVSHFYKDITFPDGDVTLSFNWKAWGENAGASTSYDYGAVVITDTTTTPAAGTEVSTTKAAAGGNGRIGGDPTYGKFNLVYGGANSNWHSESINMSAYSGQTKRLVFTWRNDSSLGTNPPFAIDNIALSGLTGGTHLGGTVYLAPTSVTPTAGTAIESTYKIGSTTYTGATSFTPSTTITLDSTGSLSNTTKRLIFSWANNTATPNNPPFNIDNVKLYTWVQLANDKT